MYEGRLLYSQDDFPVFQNRMYKSVEEGRSCPRGAIRIVEDPNSGLIYNAAFDPSKIKYDAHYQNEQAQSSIFRAHLQEVAEIVLSHMGKNNLIEVGCGKGTFLEMLQNSGAKITGFDPAYEGNNPAVERRHFNASIGLAGKGLILRHVLEHIPNPVSFISQLSAANNEEGLIYIEVPCFDWICEKRAWFDIFYEHVNYFRLTDFDRIFGNIVKSGKHFGGQYLYILADLASVREPKIDPNDRVSFPDDFTASMSALNASSQPNDAPRVIWGGASKGVIFSLLSERAGKPVDRAIDINPAKQGRYLAATGLLVQSPQDALSDLSPGAEIYVMNPNYMSEIKELTQNAFTYIEVGNE